MLRRDRGYVQLERLKYSIREHLGPGYTSDSALIHRVYDDLCYEISVHVLAERLPPETLTRKVSGSVLVSRPTTWWDHFKDTYRERWWMRWRRWAVATTIEVVPYEDTVTVDIQGFWTYPQARINVPDYMGDPVYVCETTTRKQP